MVVAKRGLSVLPQHGVGARGLDLRATAQRADGFTGRRTGFAAQRSQRRSHRGVGLELLLAGLLRGDRHGVCVESLGRGRS